MPLIKRYSNRKLYDVEKSQYVNLDSIAEMVRQGVEVKVVDYATGADLTAVTLTQVIFEQEKKLGSLLPQAILTRMLRTGTNALQTLRGGVNVLLDQPQFIEDEIRRRCQQLAEEGVFNKEEADRISSILTTPRLRSALNPPPTADMVHEQSLEFLRQEVEKLEAELTRLNDSTKK